MQCFRLMQCRLVQCLLLLSLRLPEGQADADTGAAGKLHSLEEQLLRAKEQINSYRSLPVDGEKHTFCDM